MLQIKKLEIYPTSRAIREQLFASLAVNNLLPKTITIGDFEKKAFIIPGKTFVDEDTKVLLLQQASDFSHFKSLNIDREFFSFLRNSKYLFSFFEELAVEMVDLETLKAFDTYADYHEHLEILDTLQKTYIKLLDENNLVDKMTLPSSYTLNQRYIASFDEITLHLEGYLSRFEMKVFLEISKITQLYIHIHANSFNQKMIDMFCDNGFDITQGYTYILDISRTKVHTQMKRSTPLSHYEITKYENKIEQIGYIKKKIFDFTEQGISPEKIIVVLPNPSSSKLLDLFDDENNFNFAMGFGYQQTAIYKRLSALYEYYTEKSFENLYRIKSLGYDPDTVQQLQNNWGKRLQTDEISTLLNSLISHEESDAYKIFNDERILFSKLLPTLSHYPFHKIMHLFLNRLAKQSMDDTRGGKITVLEILETRGIQKDAVIVVDFNEGTLPSSSKKDLFLSSSIRAACKLPTPSDRENLQKYYYKRIFDTAKEVAISYMEDEQNQPSRFIDELQIDRYYTNHADMKSILLPFHKPKQHFKLDDLVINHDFTKTQISATRLKTFLDCKRKYYFKYIKELPEFEIPKEQNTERMIGTYIHAALKNIYTRSKSYYDSDTLLFDLQRELYTISENDLQLRFLIDIWIEKLKPFVTKEIERFAQGFSVHSVEKKFTASHEGLILTGTIDRIDTKDNAYFILDYKTGKIPKTTVKSLPNTTDFQLQFYYLLTQQLGTIADTFYYDLNTAALVDEPLFDEKIFLLEEHLKSLLDKEFNFTMTEELKKCTYCPYTKICNRIL